MIGRTRGIIYWVLGLLILSNTTLAQDVYCTEDQRCADRGDGTYQNPILGGDYPDPSILRVEDDYYMTHSSFIYYPGLLIWHSKDLVNWEPVCHALHKNVGSVYAPDFIKYKDKYYIYFPANGTNWVVTAPAPKGSWSDPIDLKVSFIDPGHVIDGKENRYLHLSDGNLIQLTDDGLSVIGGVAKVYNGWEIPDSFNVECFCLESPKLTFRKGYYYLTSAQGGTAGPPTSHMVVSARSKSPTGPWENSPYNPIIYTMQKQETWWSKGHGTLVDDTKGKTWMFFHGYENSYHTLGRQTLMQAIEWTDDGWFIARDAQQTNEVFSKPPGDRITHYHQLSDNFSSETLNLKWHFFKDYEPQRIELKDNSLILQARGNSLSNCQPLLCIPTNYSYELQAEIEIEEGTTGGITLYYNENANCGIGVDSEKIYVIRHGRALPMGDNIIGKHIYLRLVNREHIIHPYYSSDGKTWIKADKIIEVSGYHHNSFHGFLSLRSGIFAFGEGKVKFLNFSYQGID